MKEAQSVFSFAIATLLFVLISCTGVTVDPTGMGFTVLLDPAASTSAPADLQILNGFLRLSEIEFEGEKVDESEIEFEVEQLTTIDLATGTATPSLSFLAIPAGEYEEFEIELQGPDDGDTTVFLTGTFVDSSQQQVPIDIHITESFELEMEYENYVVDSTIAFGATFLIDPIVWFQTITTQDLQQADQNANGGVVISATENTDLYGKLKDHLSEGINWEWDD